MLSVLTNLVVVPSFGLLFLCAVNARSPQASGPGRRAVWLAAAAGLLAVGVVLGLHTTMSVFAPGISTAGAAVSRALVSVALTEELAKALVLGLLFKLPLQATGSHISRAQRCFLGLAFGLSFGWLESGVVALTGTAQSLAGVRAFTTIPLHMTTSAWLAGAATSERRSAPAAALAGAAVYHAVFNATLVAPQPLPWLLLPLLGAGLIATTGCARPQSNLGPFA